MECITEKLMLRFGDKFGTLVVRIWKPAAPQATVFCIHGFEGNGSDFDYLARFLAKSGLTVVSPDMVGRGESTYFGDPNMYTISTYLGCIGALSKFASDKNHFIGTSWGGAIAIYFLCMTRIKVEKLILNDVGLRSIPAVHDAVNTLLDDVQQTFDTIEEAQKYVRQSRGFLGDFSEDLWPAYLKNKIRFSEGKYRLAYDPAAFELSQKVLARDYDLTPLLDRIDAKILLLYGLSSECYEPAMVADLLRRRPNISCIPDLKAGHPPSLMTLEQALMVGGFLSA